VACLTHLLGKLWQDDFTNIVPQLGLELETTLAIEQEILGKPSPIFPKLFIKLSMIKYLSRTLSNESTHWVFTHGLEP